MSGLRVVIVEDESVVARRLHRLLERVLPSPVQIRLVTRRSDALRQMSEQPVDLLFLDLNLNGKDGFRLLEEAVAESFQTIIVSAHTDQALRAFEYGVTDFVAKPYTEERLRQAVGRLTLREPDLREQLRYLAVRRAGDLHLVPVDQLEFVRGADDYSELHASDGSIHLHGKSLTALIELLPSRFRRVHRSFIVDTSRAATFRSEAGGRYWLELQSGAEIPVSRTRVDEVRGLFG